MRFFLSLLALTILLAGCRSHRKTPKNLIPQNKYINLLIELQLLKSYQQEQRPDSSTVDSLRKVIFKKYDVTQQQFEKSHKYYQQHVKAQNKRINEAIERLRKDRMGRQDSLRKRREDSMKARHNKIHH
ncbi:MAG TPA: DUF4296 domain-containing protein [Balneolaceae bacterium]|nr:DUF4296 domain-containing protein [Balneolaceae bacterium]